MRRIKELFDNPVDYRIAKSKSAMEFCAEFTVGTNDYEFFIVYNHEECTYDLQFVLNSCEGSEYGITNNASDVFTIFATIGEILQHWVKTFNINKFMFTAKEPSRIKLYAQFANLIQRKLNFTYEQKVRPLGNNIYTCFVFSK